MPARLLFDTEGINLENEVISREEIESYNPQRFEFQQVTRVCYFDPDEKIIVAVREIKADEFWVRGHMPGRPIFPGILMIESAAQLCSICSCKLAGRRQFGFGGADSVRFRKILTVGDHLIIVGKIENLTKRRSRCKAQGLLNGDVVFEASVFGVALPPTGASL